MPLPAGAFGGCRLLHVLVHIVGAVDHDEPDHCDRNKPDDQCCHLSLSPTPLHHVSRAGPNPRQAWRTRVASDATGYYSAKIRQSLHGRPGNFQSALCNAAKNSLGGPVALPKARAAQHKSSVNSICSERLFGARIYSGEPLCAAGSVLTLNGEDLKQLRCLNVG